MSERMKTHASRPETGLPGDGVVMVLGSLCLGVAALQGSMSTIHLAYLEGPRYIYNIQHSAYSINIINRSLIVAFDQKTLNLDPEQIQTRDATVNSWWKSVIAAASAGAALTLTFNVTKKSQEKLDLRL